MKLRKIVSIFASMTIAASTLVALSTASFAEDPQISYIVNCDLVDFTSEAYKSYQGDYDWSEYGDYSTYSVKISLKGLAMTTTVSGKSKLLSGNSITVGEIGANVLAEGQTYGDDYQIGLIGALSSAPQKNITAEYIGASYNSSSPLYPPAKTAMTVTAEDEVPGMFEFLITVDNTKPIELEFLTEKNTVATTTFESDSPVANTSVQYLAAATPATLVIPPVASEVPATGITLSTDKVTLNVEGTYTLTPTLDPSNTTDTVTWASDNESVATVADGVVTAVAPGKATITATAGSVSATCEVKVMPVKGTVIIENLGGHKVVYANSVDASTLGEDTTFEVEFKKGDVVKTKPIKSTFGKIMNGVIGEGAGVTGKVHFGIKIVDNSVNEADYGCFTVKPE